MLTNDMRLAYGAGNIVVADTVRPTDKAGAFGPSDDGYDGYCFTGSDDKAYTFRRKEVGVYEVEVNAGIAEVLFVQGSLILAENKDLTCQVAAPCPWDSERAPNKIRFRVLSGATETDLAHDDAFCFLIVARQWDATDGLI